MRLVAGTALVARGFIDLQFAPFGVSSVLVVLAVFVGVLLLAGLWTPVAGSLAGVLGLWNAIYGTSDPLASVMIGTMGVALALLGPGGWSVDARLFGWERINAKSPK
jgi:putative oxidoreductase